MYSRSEHRRLLSFARILLSRSAYHHLRSIDDSHEQFHAAEHALTIVLENRFRSIKSQLLGKEDDWVFLARAKLHLLHAYIRYFLVHYHKRDFKKMYALLRELEGEVLRHG